MKRIPLRESITQAVNERLTCGWWGQGYARGDMPDSGEGDITGAFWWADGDSWGWGNRDLKGCGYGSTKPLPPRGPGTWELDFEVLSA